MANLTGRYQLQKSNLKKEGANFSLLIGKRNKPTPKKPQNFLLYRSVTGQHTYISSLYPEWQEWPKNELQRYKFDTEGVEYTLTLDKGKEQGYIAEVQNSTGQKLTPND
jgi:hypothetical protein